MSQNKLKGFQFVLADEYEQMADDQKQGYMFFVRDNAEATEGKIYFGTRLYSSSVSSEDAATLADKIDALDMKADAIDTKTEANAMKIDAFKDMVEVIVEKIGVVKDQSDVIEQKIDDIYNDTNKMREEFEEVKTNAEEAIQKVDAETERAIAAEKVLQDEINKNSEELKAEASRVDGMVNQINENVASSINTLNQNMADGFNTINGGIAAEITERKAADEELEAKKVAWSSKDDHRIILENHKNLLGTSTEGNTYNLAMISKWNIADFGSSHLHLNLNSIDVPTVQLSGQSGEEAKHIAFSEDVPSITTVETLVNAEKDRAMEAESNLQTNINDNRNAMVQIQNGLQANINANTNAMVQIQNGLQANINANTNAINAEITARQNADAALEQKIAAINVDGLKAGIEKNASDIATVNTNLVTAINDINKNVFDGFNTINGGIATEIEERKAADEELEVSTKKNASDIATVNTNLVNAINAINQNIADGFNTINGGIATEIEERKLADETLQAKINEIGVEGMKADIKKNASNIATVNTNLVTSVNAINKNMADGFNTINGGIDNEIRPEIILLRNEMDTISLVKQSDLQYALKIGDRIAGTIDIPKEQWLKYISYDGENKVLKFTVETTEGDVETEINISDLVDVYLAGNGLELAGNVFSVKLDTASQKYIEVSENGIKVVGIDEAVKKLEDEKVSWTNIATDENPGRKAILLKNHDTILGTSTTGATPSILMLNKWDVVDLGTPQFPINLNTPAGVRPTVQEAGQSGADAYQIAYVSDIEAANTAIAAETEARSAADTQLQADLAQEGTARSEADAELQTNIDAVNTIVSELQTALTTETEARSKGDTDLQETLSQEATSRIEADTQLQDNIDAANTSIDELKEKKVDWIDIATAENPGRKAILLKNHETILGTSTTGATPNLLMLNKWDVVDLGTPQFPINLNTPAGVRPTVQEAGQSGEEANKIAYLSDIDVANTSITELQDSLSNEIANREKTDEINAQAIAAETENRKTVIESLNTQISSINESLALKAEKSEIPTALPNPNALTIKYNGIEAFTYDGSSAETGNFIVNAGTVVMSDTDTKTIASKLSEIDSSIESITNDLESEVAQRTADDTKNAEAITAETTAREADITDVKNSIAALGIFDMGDFTTLEAASERACNGGVYDNKNYRILKFTVGGKKTGTIINAVDDYKTEQYMYYDMHRYRRSFNRVGDNAYVTNWAYDCERLFPGKGIRSTLLFALNESSNSDSVKEALTYPNGDGVLTKSDLEACIANGMFLLDMDTNSMFSVGRTTVNSHYTFVSVDFGSIVSPDANAIANPTINSVIIDITNEGVYSVFKAGNKIEPLTKEWEKLPFEAQPSVLYSVSDRIYSQTTILGWFDCETVAELKEKAMNTALLNMNYLNSGDKYVRIPVHLFEFKNNDSQIHFETIGITVFGDEAVKYDIVANLDGTIISGNSNVQITKEPLIQKDVYVLNNLTNLEQDASHDLIAAAIGNIDDLIEAIRNKKMIVDYNSTTASFIVFNYALSTSNESVKVVNLVSYQYPNITRLYQIQFVSDQYALGITEREMVLKSDYDEKISNLEQRIAALEGASA